MTTVAVFATGPSMSQEIADACRGRVKAVAVADAFRLAPWADALVANDMRWWNVYPDAFKFAGPKFCAQQWPGLSLLPITMEFGPGTNSGLQGARVARDVLGATRILLCGFDLWGTHYFGPHPPSLRHTKPADFERFVQQWDGWLGGCEVINCTMGSALKRFPFRNIIDVLDERAVA